MEIYNLPETIVTEEKLDEQISTPSEALIRMMKNLSGDIMILGIAGKIGINLGMVAVKAIERAKVNKQVIGVSRFSDPRSKEKIESLGIKTILCDLLEREAISKLPKVPNIIFMAGKKFGTVGSEDLTWAMNAVVPVNVSHHFKESKIVVYSTGLVYGLVPITIGGLTEDDAVNPIGEYAQSSLGRERVFEYFSNLNKTPICIMRLTLTTDLRYGVLRDIGEKVFSCAPVDVTTGYVKPIWQGDVVNQSLLCLEHCSSPSNILNIAGPETVSVRYIAKEFGKIFDKDVKITGEESQTAFLMNAAKTAKLFGYPKVPLLTTIKWVAKWIEIGGRSLNKPTHFEVRNGRF